MFIKPPGSHSKQLTAAQNSPWSRRALAFVTVSLQISYPREDPILSFFVDKTLLRKVSHPKCLCSPFLKVLK